ncbi:hypothetical protein [Arthrobacter sp. NPDC058192]|uniref:hypothetical protein n=1 Tax=Arthrobacter sp. NPDC058192 TaxID=3346372 RepID=UPI0036ED944D
MPADSPADDKPKQFLGLSGTQTIGSALAAVTSALVGSFTGVAGTLIGAALGSVVATVGAALYARTLSSAATVAMRKIPQRGRDGLPVADASVLVAGAPAERDDLRVKRLGRQFTRKTWIKLGAVSAAAFAIAMVGVTAVEFGTNKPISSLVSSTSSIDGAAAAHTTTLGQAFSGTPTVPDKTGGSTENLKQLPGQTEEGASKENGVTTDGSPSRGDSGSAGTEAPKADVPRATTPAEPAPETEQTSPPSPATEPTSQPEVTSDPGSAEQPTR